MAELNEQTIRGIAGSLLSRARQDTLGEPRGVFGKAYEAVTGQIKEYNEQVEKLAESEAKLEKTELKLQNIRRKRQKLETQLRQGLVIDEKMRKRLAKMTEDERRAKLEELREKLADQTEQLAQTERELTRDRDRLSATTSRTRSNLEEMNRTNSILGNGLGVLAGKVATLTAGFFSLREAVGAMEVRAKLAASSLADTGVSAGGTWDNISALTSETLRWNESVSRTVTELGRLGMSAEQTHALMGTFRDELRLTTENQGDLRAMTERATQDVGFMAQLLRVNTEDLAQATTDASKRFGKSVGSMTDEMAGMYVEIQRVKQANRDTIVNFRDITKATLEAQASFQGYNLNLRTTASLMAGMTSKMQEQGATYEMAQKGAQGMFDTLAGGKAPDWAKYMAGQDLQREVRKAVKGIGSALDEQGNVIEANAQKVREALVAGGVSAAEKMTDMQVANLQDLANNWRDYGELSSANMTEEMLRGSREGMKAMLQIMEKTSSGPEMREVLKQVWGLDDQAASAATLALRRGGFDAMLDEMSAFKQQADDRKPVTVGSVREQTKEMVENIAKVEKGVDGLTNFLKTRFSNPLFMTLAGFTGVAMSGLMQALQMGAGVAVAGAFQKSGMAGALSSAASRAGGFAKMAAGGAAKLGLVGAAGVGAYMAMTKVREAFPVIDEFTQYAADNMMRAVDTVTMGLFKFNRTLNEEEATRKGLMSLLEGEGEAAERTRRVFGTLTETVAKGARAQTGEKLTQSQRFISGMSREDLMAYAEEIAKRTKMSETEVLARLRQIQQTAEPPRPRPQAAEPTQAAQYEPRKPGPNATRRTPRAPELSVAQQAVAQPTRMQQMTRVAPNLTSPQTQRAGGAAGQTGTDQRIRQGNAQVGPDGNININLMIPRAALDKSNLMASANTE